MNRLVIKCNTIAIIEHNMDMIKVADYMKDIGWEGGSAGRNILFMGTPEGLLKLNKGYTSIYLAKEM